MIFRFFAYYLPTQKLNLNSIILKTKISFTLTQFILSNGDLLSRLNPVYLSNLRQLSKVASSCLVTSVADSAQHTKHSIGSKDLEMFNIVPAVNM